jgi:hypothetical protein
MNRSLLIVLGGITVSLGAMVAGLSSWEAATTPTFIGGAIGAIGTAVGALYTEKPQPKA